MLTRILPDAVRVVAAGSLPERWAAELGMAMVPGLGDEDARLLQERSVPLGHGVVLSHLRSALVSEPTLGAWRIAAPPEAEDRPWLYLVALIPSGDPTRHLGWMAHLAASLHDPEQRVRLRAAPDAPSLAQALADAVRDRQQHVHRQDTPVHTPIGAAGHRLIVAILKEVEFVDHLLALYLEYDVRGATVLEGRGMAEHLAAHMSLFAGFKSAFKSVGHSQIVLTVVPAERTDEVLELIREAAGGMKTPGSGIAFAVDVPASIGLDKKT